MNNGKYLTSTNSRPIYLLKLKTKGYKLGITEVPDVDGYLQVQLITRYDGGFAVIFNLDTPEVRIPDSLILERYVNHWVRMDVPKVQSDAI